MKKFNRKRGFAQSHRQRKHTSRKSRSMLKLLLFLLVSVILSLYIFNIRFKPIIRTYAEHQAQNTVHQLINSKVEAALLNGNISYQSFIALEKDGSGHISAITTNMPAMNTFKAGITDAILKEVADLPPVKLKVPAGIIFGSEYFAGHGPNIPVKVLPFSAIKSSYSNSFTSAGINQTRHQIMMHFSASVGLLFPGFREDITVDVEICVAETVIVGTTPQFFAGIQSSSLTDYTEISG